MNRWSVGPPKFTRDTGSMGPMQRKVNRKKAHGLRSNIGGRGVFWGVWSRGVKV